MSPPQGPGSRRSLPSALSLPSPGARRPRAIQLPVPGSPPPPSSAQAPRAAERLSVPFGSAQSPHRLPAQLAATWCVAWVRRLFVRLPPAVTHSQTATRSHPLLHRVPEQRFVLSKRGPVGPGLSDCPGFQPSLNQKNLMSPDSLGKAGMAYPTTGGHCRSSYREPQQLHEQAFSIKVFLTKSNIM